MSKPQLSFWTGGGFLGGDQSSNFVDRSRPTARVDVLNAETPEQVERALTSLAGVIQQFWRAADTQHQLSGRDHAYYRQRVAGAELAYFSQAGQPVIQVRADPIVLQVDDPPEAEPVVFEEDLGRPILIERPRKGSVIKRICYEVVMTQQTFLNYPPALWATRTPPIPPIFAGEVPFVDAYLDEINAVYGALTPEQQQLYPLVRIVTGTWTDGGGINRKGYAIITRAFDTQSQEWAERPAAEFPGMDLLPIERPPGDDGPVAPPQTPEEAQQLLEEQEPPYTPWPNGSPASVHDFFGPDAPQWQTAVTQNGEQVPLSDGSFNVDRDPEGMPDEPLNLCGVEYETIENDDPWGHPASSQPPQGDNENNYWVFAPLTFWRPDGSEIVGPHPTGIEGEIPQSPPYDPMSTVDPDFIFWLQRL